MVPKLFGLVARLGGIGNWLLERRAHAHVQHDSRKQRAGMHVNAHAAQLIKLRLHQLATHTAWFPSPPSHANSTHMCAPTHHLCESSYACACMLPRGLRGLIANRPWSGSGPRPWDWGPVMYRIKIMIVNHFPPTFYFHKMLTGMVGLFLLIILHGTLDIHFGTNLLAGVCMK